MGFFDGIGSVDPSGASPRFPPDIDAVIRVHDIRVGQGQWGTRYIVEADVLSSNSPSLAEGARHSWTVRIDGDYGKMGLGEVKSFVAACQGIDPNDTHTVNSTVTPAMVDATLQTGGNILRGCVVRTQTSGKTTKSGQEITKHLWMVVDGAEAAMLNQGAPPLGAVSTAGAPAAPPPPGAPSAPAAAPFPPTGWTAHPSAPGFFYKGTEVKSESELRAMSAPPPAAAPTPPPVPPAPAAPPGPPAATPWPPPGWAAHPTPGYFYKGQDVKSEAQLRAAQAAGAA